MKYILLLLIFITSNAFSAKNLFENIDAKSAKSTGIDKLSLNEQIALTQWLKSSKKDIIKKERKKNMGFRKEESQRQAIHTSIVGEFKGWQGKNIFKLANGQIWKQSEKTSFYIPKKINPEVTIKPKSMNSWALYVDGFGRSVKVKRIK